MKAGKYKIGKKGDYSLFLWVNGNQAGVKWDGISRFPADVTGSFPFPVARFAEDVLGGFVEVEPIGRILTPVHLDHILTDEILCCEAKEPFHSRIDVLHIEVTICDGDQLYKDVQYKCKSCNNRLASSRSLNQPLVTVATASADSANFNRCLDCSSPDSSTSSSFKQDPRLPLSG